jgi:group I intron endonuclease
MPSIYKITNIINNKSYIGYTSRDNVQERISEHFSPSVYNVRDKRPLYSAIKKYGVNSFRWEVLYEGDDALDKEPEYITKYGDYNLHEGGNVPPSQKGKTWKLSEETKQKMRKPKSPFTEEHKKALSESKKGKIPWNKGLTKDDERVRKYTEERMKTMGYLE